MCGPRWWTLRPATTVSGRPAGGVRQGARPRPGTMGGGTSLSACTPPPRHPAPPAVFKLAVYSQAGETYWEEGANRSLHVPLACVPLTAEDPGQLVKAVCAWGETAGTRLQPNELGAENLRVRGVGGCAGVDPWVGAPACRPTHWRSGPDRPAARYPLPCPPHRRRP